MVLMTDTLSGGYGSHSPASSFCVIAPQRKLGRALATSVVLIVTNTTTEAEAAKPKTFDISTASTSASAPAPINTNSVTRIIDYSDQVITQIREIGMLNNGWHREGSLGASQKALDEAERFARSIDWQHHEPPIVSLTEDGEINLIWQTDALYLDLGFDGDGTYSYYGKATDGKIFLGDNFPTGDPLPAELLALMSIQA